MANTRSNYLAKLSEFPGIVFDDVTAFSKRGRWGEFFDERMEADGERRRVVLEIGCNDAALLARVAARHPGTAFVGIDWKCKAVYDAAGRVAGMGLRNVALIRGRAQDVARVFGAGELDEIWLFHPDPCDRPAELKNRLISEPFLNDVHAVLRGGLGTFTLKTDHPGYYQWTLALLGLPQPTELSQAAPGAGIGIESGDKTATSINVAAKRGSSLIMTRVKTSDDPLWAAGPLLTAKVPPPAAIVRVRTRDLMPVDRLPPVSEIARGLFETTMRSADFWRDGAAQAHVAGRLWASEVTTFEARFVRKRWSIYLIDLRKR